MRCAAFTASLLLLVALTIPPPQVSAQGDPHIHTGAVGWVPREIMERPTILREAAVRSVGNALTGNALLVMKGPEAAQTKLVEAEGELKRITAVGALSVAPGMVRPYIDALRGEMLLRSGQHPEGARLLKAVQHQIRAIPGADAWIQALFRLESIARCAREAGNWELAEYTAKQMLDHDASYAGTHYALALVAEHKGEVAIARKEFEAAVKLWGKADTDLAELRHAHEKLKH